MIIRNPAILGSQIVQNVWIVQKMNVQGHGSLSPVKRSWVSQPNQQIMGFSAPSTSHGFLSPVNRSWVPQPRQQVMGLSAPGHGFSISFFLLGAGRPCRYDRILFLFDWGGAAMPLRQNLVFVCLGRGGCAVMTESCFCLLWAGRPCRYDRILFLFAWAHRC